MACQAEKRLTQVSLAAALLASAATLASPFLLPPVAVVVSAATTTVLCSVALASVCRRRAASSEELLKKAAREAEEGRKLVIYERTTGLLAHWYMAVRVEEECARAQRYGKAFTLAVLEPAPDANEWALHGLLTEWLGANVRASDLAGYAGNGRFVVLMPWTDGEAAEAVFARLNKQVANVEMGTSVFPADGTSFDELYSAARDRLDRFHRAA